MNQHYNATYATVEEINDILKKENITNDNISCLHFNARSLVKRIELLKDFLDTINHKFHYISISETWGKEHHQSFYLEGYNFEGKNRSGGKNGGGVGLFIRNDIDYEVRNDLSNIENEAESIFVECKKKNSKNIIVGSIYIPPHAVNTNCLETVENLVNQVCQNNKTLYLMGDTNIPLNNKKNKIVEKFDNIIESYDIKALVQIPTRVTSSTQNILDNIFCNKINEVLTSHVILDDLTSDHMPICSFSRNINKNAENIKEYIYKRKINSYTQNRFRKKLIDTDFTRVFNETDPNKALEIFESILYELYYRAFPKTKIKINDISAQEKTNKPWFDSKLKILRQEKELAFKKFMNEKTSDNERAYHKVRNKFTALERRAKLIYLSSDIDKAPTSKLKWSKLNKILNRNHKSKSNNIRNIKSNDNRIINDPMHIANEFNEYFNKIGKNLAASIESTEMKYDEFLKNGVENDFNFHLVTDDVIERIMKQVFKNHKAPGIDEIQGTILKDNIDVLKLPISYLINLSLFSGIFPDKLKVSLIRPLHKEGSKEECNNYRPISLLPSLSKVYEKAISEQLVEHFIKNKVLSKNQFGFRKKRNTTHAIMSVIEIISNALNNKEYTLAVFLDLRKAFDTVDLDILIDKLKHYGIRGNAIKFIENYLKNRTQIVQIENRQSNSRIITHGVPQGSILGPLLFIIYINDLCTVCPSLFAALFADDSNFFKIDKSLKKLKESMDDDLIIINQWLKANKLSINLSKTKSMVICTRQLNNNPLVNISINEASIEQVDTTKFLGVYINKHMNWSHHINTLTKKMAKLSGMMYKAKSNLSEKTCIELYKSLILPHLTYANVIWGASCLAHLDQLIKCQKRLVRIATSSSYNANTAPLFKKHRILKIEDINYLETIKIAHDYYYNNLPDNFSMPHPKNNNKHNYETRQRNDFSIDRKNNNISEKTSVLHRGMSYWNKLPSEIKMIRSKKLFIKEIQNMILSNY